MGVIGYYASLEEGVDEMVKLVKGLINTNAKQK